MDDFGLRSTLEEEAPPFTPESVDEIRQHLLRLREQVTAGSPPDQLTRSQIQHLLDDLPKLTEQDLITLGHRDSLCPICLTPYLAILSEEETALAMDSPAHPVEDLGVTRLVERWQCGHIFCRRDISKWIKEARDSCPMCRQKLLVRPTASVDPPESSHPVTINRPVENLFSSPFDDPLLATLLLGTPAHIRDNESHEQDGRDQFSTMYS